MAANDTKTESPVGEQTSPCPRFTLRASPSSSGSYTAILDEGVQPEDVLVGLQNLYERSDVVHLDLSAYPTREASDDHSKLSNMLLPFALKESVISIRVPQHWIHRVKGTCKGVIVKTFREVMGPYVNIMGQEVPISDAVDPQELLDKFCDANEAATGDMLQVTYKVLKAIKTMNEVPHVLGSMVVNAAKYIRRQRKRNKRARKVKRANDDDDDTTDSGESHADQTNPTKSEDPTPKVLPQTILKSLGKMTVCYVCKQSYYLPRTSNQLDASWIQYPKLCHVCALLNFEKRNQSCDLQGRYAVVTGGRIKIGYHIVIKLLRDGCNVIATTRFPHDAVRRFQREPDFDNFKSRLKVYPLDLKNVNGVYAFIDYVERTFPHLDILINNAAQTIRRPKVFFQHMLSTEMTPDTELDDDFKCVLATDQKLNYGIGNKDCPDAPSTKEYHVEELENDNTSHESTLKPTLPHPSTDTPPAKIPKLVIVKGKRESGDSDLQQSTSKDDCGTVMSQTSSCADNQLDTNCDTDAGPSSGPLSEWTYFPRGVLDADGQQVDLRPHNSWRLELEQVPVPELLEVLTINTIAPFILTQRLKRWLDKSPNERRFVVNVSAMEGQFNRAHKNHYHPHTNMAKASLNMLTRTAGVGFRDTGVFMTAVDTGWVTDERPYPQAQHEQDKGFVLPLDTIDGAARVYDPIVSGLTSDKEPYYAVFLKDYKEFPW